MRLLTFGLACLVVAACSHDRGQRSQQDTGQQVAARGSTAAQDRGDGSITMVNVQPVIAACSVDDNCSPKQLCIRSVCTDIGPELAECAATRVYFDKDAAQLGPNARQNLTRVARCLKADQRITVTIAGNADSSGTEQHNRQLGDRRASAVADFLTAQGVSGDQLRTISFGDEMPVCWTENADCMAKNRRVAVKPYPQRRKEDLSAMRKTGTQGPM